jgi:hypothetical protein
MVSIPDLHEEILLTQNVELKELAESRLFRQQAWAIQELVQH